MLSIDSWKDVYNCPSFCVYVGNSCAAIATFLFFTACGYAFYVLVAVEIDTYLLNMNTSFVAKR